MSTNSKRLTCPIRGCQRTRTSAIHLLCARHWFMLRRELRDKIYEAFRTERGSDNHRMLIDAAIEEVESQEAINQEDNRG